jgi:amidase
MDLAEYAACDGLELAELVRRGDVTPEELAALAAEGTSRVNGRLGAVIELFVDRVEHPLGDARPTGPFVGVPLLLKDLYHGEAGRVCENGSRLSEGWVVPSDTGLIQRIRRSGLASLGRATTSEWGIMGTTETAFAGPTCSPWSQDHIAGGSSGGAGASVGAGIVPIAIASDGGGSIRIPAACCGVVGLKPSRGRISFGPDAGEPLSGWAVRFAVSRTVRDSAALLDALHGPEPGDPTLLPPPERPYLDECGRDPGRLRIAFCTAPWNGAAEHPEHAAATEATARLLTDLGHDVEQAAPAVEWEPFLDCMVDMWSANTAHGIDLFGAALGREPSRENLEPVTYAMWRYGAGLSGSEVLAALDHVNGVNRRLGAFFADWDVLLTPTLGHPQQQLGAYAAMGEASPREVFGGWAHIEGFLPFFNCSGQPAISLPLHQATTGLPIGMQLVGRLGDEATLIRVAAQLESAQPWRDRVPPIHVSR